MVENLRKWRDSYIPFEKRNFYTQYSVLRICILRSNTNPTVALRSES